MGRPVGIEPTSAGATIRCVNHFATTAMLDYLIKVMYGVGGGDRTPDLTGMNRTLSPAELRRHEGSTGRIRTYDQSVNSRLLYH